MSLLQESHLTGRGFCTAC